MKLEVRDLTCARGGLPVIEGLSFTLSEGEALILRGPNGIGKTTLLRTLAGLQPALAGRVDLPEGAGAYASHADGVKEALTVAENLSFWASVYDTELDESVYAAFDIADLRDRFAGTLSSGQKRRAGLARLAVMRRPVLFLDEPTISLDARSVRLFADFIRDRHLATGGIAVIATHIDLGLDARTLDLEPYRAELPPPDAADEAFL